jgi:hypothetical protein
MNSIGIESSVDIDAPYRLSRALYLWGLEVLTLLGQSERCQAQRISRAVAAVDLARSSQRLPGSSA